MRTAYQTVVATVRRITKAMAALPYWGMALAAAAVKADTVDLTPAGNGTQTLRMKWQNPKHPKADPKNWISLAKLFPDLPPGTIDSQVKYGIVFALCCLRVSASGAKSAFTPAAWQTIAKRYGVGYDDVLTVGPVLRDWYLSPEATVTVAGMKAVIDGVLSPVVAEPEAEGEGEPEGEPEPEEANPILAMLMASTFPKKGADIDALIVDARSRGEGHLDRFGHRWSAIYTVVRAEAEAAKAEAKAAKAEAKAA